MDDKKRAIMNILARYPRPHWAVEQIIRGSGLVEDICEHGVGHPNRLWLQKNDPDNKMYMSTHGCDGCCCKRELPSE